jgi:hypothetical protein
LIDTGIDNPAKGRQSITTGSQTIDLGSRRRQVRVWLDKDASEVHISLEPASPFTVTATDSFPRIDDGIGYARAVAYPGTRYIHFIGTGTTGKLNYEAW